MSVIGFDFGTESCIISVCKRGSKGGPDVLQNEVGNRKTRSMVAFSAYSPYQRYMGDSAVSQAMGNAKNTIHSFKNLLRVNRFDHPDFKTEIQYLPYKLVDIGEGAIGIQVKNEGKTEVFSPQQIAASMLSKLKSIAESSLRTKVVDCVISIPPMWTEEERRAMLDAAKIAGLNVLRLMNENLAVAVTYGLLRRLPAEPIKVLFVDVGAGHTNASVVQFSEGKLAVQSAASAETFGGRTLDLLLFDHLAQHIQTAYKMDITSNTKATLKLMKEAQAVKVKLSANTTVNWAVEYIMNDRDVKGTITRAEFDAMAASSCTALETVIQSAISKAGVTVDQLHSCEVIGGGVRIPIVQTLIKNLFGRELSKTCDADESVAKGCALQCAMLSPLMKVRDFDVVDIQPYDVVAEWGTMSASSLELKDDALFAAQSPVPSFSQVAFEGVTTPFQVVSRYADPNLRGSNRFVISGFPVSFVDPNPTVKVKFHTNVHGLVTVTQATLRELEPEVEEPAPEPAAEAAEGAAPEGAAPEAEKKDESAMDTTPDAPAPEKKKTYKRTALKVDEQTCGLDKKARDKAFEREVQMAAADRLVVETSEARDILERYVLDMTSKVQSQNELAPYAQANEASTFLDALTTEDDWLASDEGYEATKKEYKGKLSTLYKMGAPLVHRKFEAENRAASVATLKKMVGKFQAWALQTDDVKYAHITAEQRQVVTQKCNEVDQWISTELSKQDRIPINQDPSLTKQVLITKAKELDGVCKPILNTPIPAPPKVEEKKEETKETKMEDAAETPTPEGAAEPEQAADGSAPMDQTD